MPTLSMRDTRSSPSTSPYPRFTASDEHILLSRCTSRVMHLPVARLHRTHHSLLHIHLLSRCLRRPFQRNSWTFQSLLIGRQGLGKLRALADLRTLPVEDVDRDGEEESETGQDGGWVFERVRWRKVLIDCEIGRVSVCMLE